jgi:hypothetical protein
MILRCGMQATTRASTWMCLLDTLLTMLEDLFHSVLSFFLPQDVYVCKQSQARAQLDSWNIQLARPMQRE